MAQPPHSGPDREIGRSSTYIRRPPYGLSPTTHSADAPDDARGLPGPLGLYN